MDEVFLTNETFVRSVTNIDDNVQSKYLLSAIREAQEVNLQEIIGSALLEKLKSLVAGGSIEDSGNTAYKKLVEQSQLFLAYQVIAKICIIASVKISNGVLQTTSDENLNPVSIEDSFTVRDYYQAQADFFASRLQAFILNNKADYPELSQNKCADIRATLNSAASTNLWLGGRRGRR